MKQVSVIISNKDNQNLLKSSLVNLYDIKQTHYENLEVIVVDNASTDNSIAFINEKYPWVKIVETKDLGLAHANNLGAKEASGDYLLFLGADGYPRYDTIGNLVDYLDKHLEVGIATPKLSIHGGKPDQDAHRSFPTPWNAFTRLSGIYKLFPKSKFFNSYFMGHENPNIPHEIDAGVSSFLMMSRKVFNELNGFDEEYFAYGEDLDFCYRLKKKGYKVMYLPQWESGHFRLRLTNDKTPLDRKIKIAKSSTDAMRVFLRKNYKDVYPPAMATLIQVAINLIEIQRLLGVILKHTFSNK